MFDSFLALVQTNHGGESLKPQLLLRG